MGLLLPLSGTGSTRLRAPLGCSLVLVGWASAFQVGASVCQRVCNTLQQSTPARKCHTGVSQLISASHSWAAGCGVGEQGWRTGSRVSGCRARGTHTHTCTHTRAPFFCALHTRLCRQLVHARVWFERRVLRSRGVCQASCVSRLLGEGRVHTDTGTRWRTWQSKPVQQSAESSFLVWPPCCSPSWPQQQTCLRLHKGEGSVFRA